jgi:hypothetical protein
MKKILIITSLLLLISCKKEKNQTNNNTISLIKDIKVLNNKTYKTPIKTFNEYASINADKTIRLTKENIKSTLEKAKEYSSCAIVVGNHTVVKIINLNDCKQSRAWAACMPKAEGYIKKGKLNYKKEYANNIIGIPDSQERMVYLFK